jgi:predicted RNase H-like nuclease
VVAGVTPWGSKWVVASAKLHAATFAPEPPKIFDSFLEVLNERPSYSVIVINAPIGFVDSTVSGPRTCDRQARAILGRRGSAVHNAPTLETINHGPEWPGGNLDAISAVLLPRYQEVAAEMSPYRQRVVYEGHPELSFFQLNENKALLWSKKTTQGREERKRILVNKMPGAETIIGADLARVPRKHLFDAAALLWTSRRVFGHAAIRLPREGEWDSEGLRMELVY